MVGKEVRDGRGRLMEGEEVRDRGGLMEREEVRGGGVQPVLWCGDDVAVAEYESYNRIRIIGKLKVK